MPPIFKDLTAEQLATELAALGVRPRLARQLQRAVIRTGRVPAELPSTSPKLLERVRQAAVVPHLEQIELAVSAADGFAKFLFRGQGPQPFEAVRIPLFHRPHDRKYVVCVSSQAGCGMGCVFCATARLGFQRNLAAWEIVDQVVKIQVQSPHPVRGVVFMGMGEPLLNYEAVIRAAQVMAEPCGLAIGAKAITVSTVGIVPGINRFTAERQPYRLVVSLSSADAARRRELLPVERAYPTASLIEALRGYHAASGQRVTLAWTMIAGVNTSADDARRLAELTRGLPVKIDLIDVNDPTGRFLPPGPEELNAFRDALRRHLGMPVVRRYSGGQDIWAGCGMLAGMRAEPNRKA